MTLSRSKSQPTMPSAALSARLRSCAVAWRTGLGWGLGVGLGLVASGVWTSAAAQSLGPAELAAKALASAPVRAVAQAKAQSSGGNTQRDQAQAANEAQLDAIRQAILEATLDRPTRVISSAWVDEQGALHETAHFHSEAQVRGVRVLSYVQDDEPQTRVSAEVLPWGWRAAGKDAACTAPPRPWRLPLLVQTLAPEGFSGPQQFASQTLLGLAQQSWTQHMQSSQRWRVQASPSGMSVNRSGAFVGAAHNASNHASNLGSGSTHNFALNNAYMRALTGQLDEPSGWTAELSLVPHAPNTEHTSTQRSLSERLKLTAADPLWHWSLSLRLGQRHSPSAPLSVHWQVSQVVSVSPAQMADNPSAWAQRLQGQLQEQMHLWMAQLDQHTACEPVQFHVTRQGPQQLELQAGADSGLRPGDRVLLVNPGQVPSRMLEAGVAQHLALAEVVRVGPQRTVLQALAGPALTSAGPWMALPL